MMPDDTRIENIINLYGDLLYRTGIMILGNPQDVQDVLQEVMLKVLQKMPEFHDRELLQEIIHLPSSWRIVLLLHYVEGYSLKEIADILAVSENAVKKRMQRAKAGLKKKLQGN